MTAATMTCPKCHATMVSYLRLGVAVDRCPGCGGLFLDHDDLDDFIAAEHAWREAGPVPALTPSSAPYQAPHQAIPAMHEAYGHEQPHPAEGRSFLQDLFD